MKSLLIITTVLLAATCGHSQQEVLNQQATDGGAGHDPMASATSAPSGCQTFTLPQPHWGGEEHNNYLAPFMSAETIKFHYYKHQAGYVSKVKAWYDATFTDGVAPTTTLHPETKTPYSMVLDIILNGGSETEADNNAQYKPVRHLASQIYNHHHFFSALDAPYQEFPGHLDNLFTSAVKANFGDREAMLKKMKEQAIGHFGSGWVWLAVNKSAPLLDEKNQKVLNLVVLSTHDAETPVNKAGTLIPLLTVDVWEHAYYIDYRNDRGKYFDAWSQLVNWKVVGDRYRWPSPELAIGGDGCIPALRDPSLTRPPPPGAEGHE